MVFAWSACFAKMCGAVATECVSERISVLFTLESCSEMRLGMHPVAAAPHIFAKRALRAHHFWCSRGARASR
eukprot:11204647-Lingulodinium_polyedra.AAC.1